MASKAQRHVEHGDGVQGCSPQQWRRPEVVDATTGGAHNLTATSAAQAWPERGKATHTECGERLEERWEAERCEEI
jgi:hypothetical protein